MVSLVSPVVSDPPAPMRELSMAIRPSHRDHRPSNEAGAAARWRHGGSRAAVALVLVGALAGCNVNRLLATKDKDTSAPGQVESAAGIPNARAGAISQFQVAYGGSAAQAGNANEGQINMTALFTDEYVDLETFPTRIAVDDRNVTAGNGSMRGIFLDLSQSRVSAERAENLYRKFDPTNVLHAEMLNLAGYSYLMFAENYCSGVPFDSVAFDGSVHYGTPLTTDSIYGRALADFAAATPIATADTVVTGDPKGIEQINLARVGRARVLLDRGQFAAARAVADSVDGAFQYVVEGSTNAPRENNGVWYFATQLAFGVSDVEGVNGLDFVSAGDPRVLSSNTGGPGFSGVGPNFIAELTYPAATSNIPVASALEAALIDAEVRLKTGDIGGWKAKLDSLRANAISPAMSALTADSTTLAPSAMQVDVMFRERAFWLYLTDHRLSDMRRLIRQYGRGSETVFPTGTTVSGTTYGTDVTFPVSSDEANNPNFHGCIDRNP
jgi:hypothetical protein